MIESLPVKGARTEVLCVADMAGCVAKLAELADSGAKLIGIHYRGQAIHPLLMQAALVLARRQTIIERLGICFNLSRLEAEEAFGHLLVEHASRVQELLLGTPPSMRAASLGKTIPPGSPAHLGPDKNIASPKRPMPEDWLVNETWNVGSPCESGSTQPGAGAEGP